METRFETTNSQIPSERSHPAGWLSFVRVLSLAVCGLTAFLFLSKIPAYYEYMRDICHRSACESALLTPIPHDALVAAGFSTSAFASLHTWLVILFFSVYCMVTLMILVKKPREPFSYLTAITLIVFPSSTFIVLQWQMPGWLATTIDLISYVFFILFLLLFPNGKIIRNWSFYTALSLMTVRALSGFWAGTVWGDWPLWVTLLWFVLQYGSILYYRYVRYRDTTGAVEKQQTKWIIYGIVLSLTGLFLISIIPLLLRADFYTSPDPVWMFWLDVGVQLMMLPIPVTLGIAMIRRRLWDIDAIVNRTIVYAGLSASIVVTAAGCDAALVFSRS